MTSFASVRFISGVGLARIWCGIRRGFGVDLVWIWCGGGDRAMAKIMRGASAGQWGLSAQQMLRRFQTV